MIKKLVGLVIGVGIASCAMGQRAHAATLTVSPDCSLDAAINSLNEGANTGDCTASGAYETNDTINIPAGTVTLNTDLTTLYANNVTISGASRSTTTINANGHWGFRDGYCEGEVPFTQTVTLQNMTIVNAADAAIALGCANTVNLTNVEVHDSQKGVSVEQVTHVAVTNCYIHDNEFTSGDDSRIYPVGISVMSQAFSDADTPSVAITDSQIVGNAAAYNQAMVGLVISMNSQTYEDDQIAPTNRTVSVTNTEVSDNQSGHLAGIIGFDFAGPGSTTATTLSINAVTIVGNAITITEPQEVEQSATEIPLLAGMLITAKLTDVKHIVNTTIAYNTISAPSPDNRESVAGLYGVISPQGSKLHLVDDTIAGNAVTQPNPRLQAPAVSVAYVEASFGEGGSVFDSVSNGATSINGLFLHNTRNNQAANCNAATSLTAFGLEGTIDFTPTNMGHNLSDDATCTGYVANTSLYDTVDHEVKDNGGPVTTLALHDNSPAANAGVAVEGVPVDARGVSRGSYVSVGAYQGSVLGESTTNLNAGQLAKTGIFIALATPVGLFIVSIPFYLYWDFRRHKAPLLAADPEVDYTFWHHVKMVSIPVAKYRLSLVLERKLPERSDQLSRF